MFWSYFITANADRCNDKIQDLVTGRKKPDNFTKANKLTAWKKVLNVTFLFNIWKEVGSFSKIFKQTTTVSYVIHETN